MIQAFFDELFFYGIKATFLHCKWLLFKKEEDERNYYLYSQSISRKMDKETISKIMITRFKRRKHEWLNFNKPMTFDQKLQWLMLYDATPLKTKLVDKLLVREYIKTKIGSKYLIDLLGQWNSFEQIDFNTLPNQFVLKVNSGSGMNIIIKDKSTFNIKNVRSKFDYWMKLNYAYFGFEMQYRDVPLKIIAEKYIEQLDGDLYDYKIHCFNGKPYCCQVIGDRNINNHTAKQAFFDMDWNCIDITEGSYPNFERKPSKPSNWDEMVHIASVLSKDFCYVRVDLYSISNSVYFSELTFTPALGIHPFFKPKETDLEWGKMIKLPEPYSLDIPPKS